MNNCSTVHWLLIASLIIGVQASAAQAASRTALRNICRIKGQEENTLRGVGLVVGLNGTGEPNDPQTMRALARAMEVLGSPVSMTGRVDQESLASLRKIKNVAMVMVTATVPATGARRGDKIDCYVSALNGKSLEGGQLAFAALQGPNVQDKRVFALCEGLLQVDDPARPTGARVHAGCQIEQDIITPFFEDGYITLVLDRNHADFQTADAIATKIRDYYTDQYVNKQTGYEEDMQKMAHAINAANIRVKIPPQYLIDPVQFAAELLETPIYESEPEARVVINPRSGSIVISGDVEIGDVVVTHRNLVVEATSSATFAKVDVGGHNQAKLESLIQALGDLKVPADDVIEIIRGINRLGKLHAKLIIE